MPRRKTTQPAPAEPQFDATAERRRLLDVALASVAATDPPSRAQLIREARALIAELAADPAAAPPKEAKSTSGLVDFQSRLAAKQSGSAAAARARKAR